MFKLLGDVAEVVVDGTVGKVERMIEDPIGETVRTVTGPIVNGIDVIDGLTEGELRERAILKLGFDEVSGMAVDELIDWYENQE